MASRSPRHCIEHHYRLADETAVHTNSHSTVVIAGECSADIRTNEHEADGPSGQSGDALGAYGIGTYPCDHSRRTRADGSEERIERNVVKFHGQKYQCQHHPCHGNHVVHRGRDPCVVDDVLMTTALLYCSQRGVGTTASLLMPTYSD